jgi:hypothetical protein
MYISCIYIQCIYVQNIFHITETLHLICDIAVLFRKTYMRTHLMVPWQTYLYTRLRALLLDGLIAYGCAYKYICHTYMEQHGVHANILVNILDVDMTNLFVCASACTYTQGIACLPTRIQIGLSYVHFGYDKRICMCVDKRICELITTVSPSCKYVVRRCRRLYVLNIGVTDRPVKNGVTDSIPPPDVWNGVTESIPPPEVWNGVTDSISLL